MHSCLHKVHTGNCMHVAPTDTASRDLHVDIIVAERLKFEVPLVEVGPRLRTVNLESFSFLGIRHCVSRELIGTF